MNIPTPAKVASNRTARLVAEARVPAYSTSTPAPVAREHMMMVEMEHEYGGRSWSSPMAESKVNPYIDSFMGTGYMLSDVDHACKCWCGGRVNIWDD